MCCNRTGRRLHAHRDAVEQDSPHANEGVVLDGARMDGGSMT